MRNHLWIRPIPAAFGRRKAESTQERGEALFDRGESFIDGKLFTEIGLSFQPQVFGEILFRGIRSKQQARSFPGCFS
jgi:hypothetical protein